MLPISRKQSRANFSLRLMVVSFIVASIWVSNLNPVAAAQGFADPAFTGVWNKTDKQVATGAASRSYLWGPEPFTAATQEDYVEAPGGKRLVQYFDKSRMEITNPGGDKNSVYYVTNGLIARELMTGMLQLGDTKFEARTPSQIGVAGDSDDTTGPTYAQMGLAIFPFSNQVNNPIKFSYYRDGTAQDAQPLFGKYNVTYAYFEDATKHNVARPFWDFLNQTATVLDASGKTITGRLFDPVFYATGLPITEAFWSRVKVGGQVKDVLEQCFERRCLTYTPSNTAAFQVEMGNVGRHYYDWRYNLSRPVAPPPAPLNFSGGAGKTKTTSFPLHRGLAKLTLNYKPTDSSFSQVHIQVNNVDNLHNAFTEVYTNGALSVQNYSEYIVIYSDGDYVLDVDAHGTWQVEVQDWNYVEVQPGAGPGGSYNGSINGTFKVTVPATGNLTLNMQYKSFTTDPRFGLFQVNSYPLNNNIVAFQNWANLGGSVISTSQTFKLTAGDYYFQVHSESFGPTKDTKPSAWTVTTSFTPGG